MKNISHKIFLELEQIGQEFSDFQATTPFACPTGCGKCCVNPDISCSPYELLPMAMHLLETKQAESFLEKAREAQSGNCLFLTVDELGKSSCSNYRFRPLVCRAFGVSVREDKFSNAQLSLCRVFKEQNEIEKFSISKINYPMIGNSKRRLEVVEPKIAESQMTINRALIFMLEKVLLWDSYTE